MSLAEAARSHKHLSLLTASVCRSSTRVWGMGFLHFCEFKANTDRCRVSPTVWHSDVKYKANNFFHFQRQGSKMEANMEAKKCKG